MKEEEWIKIVDWIDRIICDNDSQSNIESTKKESINECIGDHCTDKWNIYLLCNYIILYVVQ